MCISAMTIINHTTCDQESCSLRINGNYVQHKRESLLENLVNLSVNKFIENTLLVNFKF